MPQRLCSTPTCPSPATYRGRCPDHARHNERTINRAGKRVYNKARWKHTRKRYLFENPLCECGCGALATDVHHHVDLDDGGDPWAFSNLEALAHECHSRITRGRQVEST